MTDKITSVRLDEENIKKLQEIAKREGIKRSVILKKAINQFIQGYKHKPVDTAEISNKVNELEKKFGSLLTRVNILTTQVDKVLERLKKLEIKIYETYYEVQLLRKNF